MPTKRLCDSLLHSTWRYVITIGLLLPFSLSAWSEPWPVKKFEIFKGRPYRSASIAGNALISNLPTEWWDLDEPIVPANDLSPALVKEIEDYLNEVANTYESLNFHPTYIEPVVENAAGQKVFRVYYHDFSVDAQGNPISSPPARRQSDDCDRVRPVFEINAGTFLQNNQLSPKNYQDLAHEVFHGIQARYPLFQRNCDRGPGDWIGEGTAQYMGADIAAYSSRKVEYPTLAGGWLGNRWGLRDYSSPLPQLTGNNFNEKSLTYGASSFWRFLGEHAATSGAEGTKAIKPDYSFLIKMFNSDTVLGSSQTKDMDWLDQQMHEYSRIKLGLDRLYPRFLTIFAAYINKRFSPVGRTPAQNQERYLQAMFSADKCPVIKLHDLDPPVRQPLKIKPFAGSCFRIEPSSSYPTDITITVYDAPIERLVGLTLGTEEGAVIVRPTKLERAGPPAATWIINVTSSQSPPVFVLTNISIVPSATEAFVGTVEFSATTSTNNMAVYGPQPPTYGPEPPVYGPQQPGNAPGSGSPSASSGGNLNTMQTQAKRVGKKIDTGLKSLSPNMSHANTVRRRPKEPACVDPFLLYPCGPSTKITLELAPGMYGSAMQSTGRGGAFGQFTSMLMGVASVGPQESGAMMEEALKEYRSIEAAYVGITLPLIDYGFTGSFNNAALTVKGRGDAVYKAIGPQDIQPGPGTAYPLAGKVTIEEYTPLVMRGRFSGDLVDINNLQLIGDDPALPIYKHIEGRFQIVATWSGDERIVASPAEDPVESVKKDMEEMMGGLSLEAVQAMAAPPGTGASTGEGGSGGAISTECTCECKMRESADELCELFCEAEFAACDNP